ncbi:Reticulon-4-interacting protein 1 [Sergentomyia squamirostris]
MNSILKSVIGLRVKGSCISGTFIRTLAGCAAEAPRKKEFPRTMKMSGWEIHSYGGIDELQFSDNIRIPQIQQGSEVMIRIKAASINPLDVDMIGGYGAALLNTLRRGDIEFPLRLGRDFVGEVIYRGIGAPRNIKLGDTVWGVVPVHKQGCHSEYLVTDSSYISHKPQSLSDQEASGVLYAGLTAWSGLFLSGDLGNVCNMLRSGGRSEKKKRVLILGASGGVGSMAVQIARYEKAQVFATASADAKELLSQLGVDTAIDYRDEQFLSQIHSHGPYDIILDCAGYGPTFASTIKCDFTSYVTFSSPLLKNTDSHGLLGGSIRNAMSLIEENAKGRVQNTGRGTVKWGYFLPMKLGIEYLKKLADRNQLQCVVDSVYGFDRAIEAYQRVKDGHLRGKIILDLS